MNILFWSDPHFTCNEIENYRWDIFKSLLELSIQYSITHIICGGDLTDRRDKFSAILVNKLIEEFGYLQIQTKASILTISGNHEKPLNGPYYWKFLDKLKIEYITSPLKVNNVWLLPFSSNPKEDWKEIDFNSCDAVFMHQTGQGVRVEGDREIPSHNLPKFPENLMVYSGDVHRSQNSNGIIYVGTPHPVRFSETWPNRVIVIENDDYKNYKEIWLDSIKRAIIDITDVKELETLQFKKKDQVRVRFHVKNSEINSLPIIEEQIRNWGKGKEIYIASLENILVGEGVKIEDNQELQKVELMKPEEVIQKFAKDEKLSEEVLNMGLEIVKCL